jgi:hypothetical protein
MRLPVTRRPWFGPKRFIGWGWSIASWEGAVATAIWVLLLAGGIFLWPHAIPIVVVVLILLYGLLVVLTGGAPGGPGSKCSG